MKVLTFSRHFPKGHPKASVDTFFVEKILRGLGLDHKNRPVIPGLDLNDFQMMTDEFKHHTIRAGNSWKAGDKFSARVWSGAPYRSKQVEFAQLEVLKVWRFMIGPLDLRYDGYYLNDSFVGIFDRHALCLQELAKNDGLSVDDFISWFNIHPKKTVQEFHGQVICWNPDINY